MLSALPDLLLFAINVGRNFDTNRVPIGTIGNYFAATIRSPAFFDGFLGAAILLEAAISVARLYVELQINIVIRRGMRHTCREAEPCQRDGYSLFQTFMLEGALLMMDNGTLLCRRLHPILVLT